MEGVWFERGGSGWDGMFEGIWTMGWGWGPMSKDGGSYFLEALYGSEHFRAGLYIPGFSRLANIWLDFMLGISWDGMTDFVLSNRRWHCDRETFIYLICPAWQNTPGFWTSGLVSMVIFWWRMF